MFSKFLKLLGAVTFAILIAIFGTLLLPIMPIVAILAVFILLGVVIGRRTAREGR